LCDDHKEYWKRYEWWESQGLPVVAALFATCTWGVAMALHLIQPVPWVNDIIKLGDDIVLLVVLSAASVLGVRAFQEVLRIHPVAITAKTVTLAGVSDKFVEVVEGERHMRSHSNWIEQWLRDWPVRDE
jgi:hypothetical protein